MNRKKRVLIIFLGVVALYLTGLSLKYLHSRYSHEAYLKTLPDIRQICKSENPVDFDAFIACVEKKSLENDKNTDPTARALVVLPKADFKRKYVAVRIDPKGTISELPLEVTLDHGVAVLSLSKVFELFSKEELEVTNLEGLSRVKNNDNFGETKIGLVDDNIISTLLVRPYSGPGFILFEVDGNDIVIKTEDIDTKTLLEKIQ